ncbi:hypothetical protein K504DRAFT_532466 [Pleomassaria siparia CBS 279.74]|uniref:Methyltransferase type 12 domain-containing protein n=1 Tax=Pleomassaria siparia CBS 279.74 TaxID=1314801 RepID=A0A6G1KE94_9PLEO|nr:hypothetical protein K504DRAFT_532466 [Pleomassaria siparia CBS 279.74]
MANSDNLSGIKKREYVLGRDYLASVRLSLQHIQETGYHVHPSIPLRAGMEIMEVATGTGIWMLDLASKYPDINFHGTDYSLEQAPPREFLPSKVTLSKWDLLEGGVPEEYVGRFDLVHVRLLVCVIKNNDPLPILEKLVKILEPGGFLQLGEMDLVTNRFEHARPDLASSSFELAFNFPSTLDQRLGPIWVSDLSTQFGLAGLSSVVDQHDFRKKSHLSFYTDAAFLAWNEWREGMDESDKERYGSILGQARKDREEAKRGLALNMEIRTGVGRKEGGLSTM